MLYELGDRKVQLEGSGHFLADNATVVGSVVLKEDVSIWFNVVIRGDVDDIIVGARSNIQDGSVLHADDGFPMYIGEDVTVGHKV
ncbi:MAG: carbonic anhydrase/acetyltransferase-like protein (isoleucine patch superfamily), partial [Zhongshania sp.]